MNKLLIQNYYGIFDNYKIKYVRCLSISHVFAHRLNNYFYDTKRERPIVNR